MSEWRHRRTVGAYEPLRVMTFPLQAENLLVMGLFTVMFTIACFWSALPSGMGIRSVAFWFLSITLLFNYGFVIVDYTARGFQRVPKLSGELVFPTHDVRLYTIAFLTLCYLAFLVGDWGADAGNLRLLIAFFTYPLLFALLIVHNRLLSLLNPVNLLRTLWIFSSSRHALLFYSLQLVTGGLLYFEIRSFGEISALNIFWQVPLTLLLVFALLRSLGVVLNSQGPALGLSVLQNADTHQDALEEQARIELDDFIMELHRWARVHEYNRAWDLITALQKRTQHKLDESLYQRLCQWDDRRLAARLGADIAGRLLKTGDTRHAMALLRQAVDMSPGKLRLPSGSIALDFAGHAESEADRAAVFACLQRFETDFPGHPGTRDALLQLATLALVHRGEPAVGRDALDRLLALDPAISGAEEYVQLRVLAEQPLTG